MENIGFAYQLTGQERFGRHGAAILEAASRELVVTDPTIAQGFTGGRGDIMRGLALGYDWLGECPVSPGALEASGANLLTVDRL
jgi:hypothetical protein